MTRKKTTVRILSLFGSSDPEALAIYALMMASNDLRCVAFLHFAGRQRHPYFSGEDFYRTLTHYEIRLAALHIHELRGILNSKALRDGLTRLSPDLEAQRVALARKLNRDGFRDAFSRIRNKTSAHYDEASLVAAFSYAETAQVDATIELVTDTSGGPTAPVFLDGTDFALDATAELNAIEQFGEGVKTDPSQYYTLIDEIPLIIGEVAHLAHQAVVALAREKGLLPPED